MKNIFTSLFLFTCSIAVCQTELTITKTDFNYNSIGEGGVTVDFILPLAEDETIDPDDFMELNAAVKARLGDNGGNFLSGPELTVAAGRKAIRIIIENLSKTDLETLKDNTDKYFISLNGPITFNSTTEVKYAIPADEFKKSSLGKILVTDDVADELVNAAGGPLYAIQNTIDFGVSPRKDTATNQTEFFLQFGYRKAYTIKSTPLFFFAEGLLSTYANDSLTFVNIYPVNYKITGKQNEIVAQAGIEGNQRFTNFRASGTFYWQGLISNLVDLTMGEDRLRLKPVLKLGVKFYQEFENNRPAENSDTEFSNQFYSEFYYYIPVKKLYSLTLKGNAFYDLNEKVNPDKEIKLNYSVIFGIEVPGTGLKTVFKYVRGENGITYEKDEMLMIGFMADLFNAQNK
jgi:hypothetical protein